MKKLALLSVSDKTNLIELAKRLVGLDFELLSTGGTARALTEAGLPVTRVADYTGSPEVMDGRVKTLHPRIHGGLLARGKQDLEDLEKLGARLIDLVVVNLYPFEEVAAKPDANWDEVIENIDIGGPTMLRSAAKNHQRVAVVCDPADYDLVIAELEQRGEISLETRRSLALKVFQHTAAYDTAIAGYLFDHTDEQRRGGAFPAKVSMAYERGYSLRYGENPHQAGAFYRLATPAPGTIAFAESLGKGAKELSYNNFVDADAALQAVREFDELAVVVMKHTNPCGVAVGGTLADAFRRAREGDPVSAFGGIVALNRPVDTETAKAIKESFFEVIVAPSFQPEALALLRKKKKLRLLACGDIEPASKPSRVFRQISGGLLMQDRDVSSADEVRKGKVVTKRSPTEEEWQKLELAWTVAKHVKSNAIVLAQRDHTVGVGAGQMSRVDAVILACRKAGERAEGAALGSDAFFPFPDGVEEAVRHGVTAVVQPGGSIRDEQVIAAADEAGITMVMTGVRHFRH